MKKKTRKTKEAAQRRYALQRQREKKLKITKLENEIIDYKELIRQGRIKNLKVYTKRILKTTGNFVLSTLPFTLAFAIISGLSFVTDSGLPFVRDDIKFYNYIDGQMDSLGNCSISSEYLSSSGNDRYCNVDVFFPWEKQDDQTYKRDIYKYEFDSSDINMNDMKEYIVKADYKSINELSDKKVVIHEVSESLNQDDINNGYFIEGDFYYKDYGDSIAITESASDNNVVTGVSLVLSALVEGAAFAISDGEIFWRVSDSARYGYTEDIKGLKLKLKKKEEELEQAKGGNSNGNKKR